MEMTGEHRIPASRKRVWEALHDPVILKDCIKGCQFLEKTSDHDMVAKVQAKVGPVKATFDAEVTIVDPVEPERYTLKGEGKGGVAGFAKGQADVVLVDEGAETLLTYKVDAKVGGKLAQLGSRLVDTTAKKYAADFFETLSAKLSGPGPRVIADAVEDAPVDPAVREATPGRIEPTPRRIDEGFGEIEDEAAVPFDSPHMEDTVEQRLEGAAANRVWGGAWFWGVLAFAAVLLVLIAVS